MVGMPLNAQDGSQDGDGITAENLADLTEDGQVEFGDISYIYVNFSPDGRWLELEGSGSDLDSLVIWNLRDKQELGYIESDNSFFNSDFSDDGLWMATTVGPTSDREIWVYQFPDFTSAYTELDTGTSLSNPQFSGDSELLFAYDTDGNLLWWPVEGLNNRPQEHSFSDSAIRRNVISPDGRWSVYADEDGRAWLWDTQSPEQAPQEISVGEDLFVQSINISADSSTLSLTYGNYLSFSGGINLVDELPNGVQFWDLASLSQTNDVGLESELLYTAVFAPDGSSFVVSNCLEWDNVTFCNRAQLDIVDIDTGLVQSIEGFDSLIGMDFSPDGSKLWLDSEVSGEAIVSVYSFPELEELMTQPGRQITLNPTGSLGFINAGTEVQVVDVATGVILMTLVDDADRISTISLSPDGHALIVTAEADNGDMFARMFSVPNLQVTQTIADNESESNSDDDSEDVGLVEGSNTVEGTARVDIESAYGPRTGGLRCLIEAGDNLLAVAKSDQFILVYSSSVDCEGPVWIFDSASSDWAGVSLRNLPEQTAPAAPSIRQALRNLRNEDSICQNASGNGSYPNGGRPYMLYVHSDIQNPSAIPTELRAANVNEIEVVLCRNFDRVLVERCQYTNNTTVERYRRKTTYLLVNYETGRIMTQTNYTGGIPDRCPQTIYGSTPDISGSAPSSGAWVDWATGLVRSNAAANSNPNRSIVLANGINARSEATTSSDILQVLPGNIPINPIARNEDGDWLVAILPDNSKAWLFSSLLRLSPYLDFEALPIVDGPAEDVAIPLG